MGYVDLAKPTLVLADDSVAMLKRAATILTPYFEILAAVTSGEAAIEESLRLKPDVVILDISMGTIGGIEVAQHLRSVGSASKVVFLTVHDDVDFVNAALEAGGSGYVIKQCMAADLVTAIRSALVSKIFVSSALLYQLPPV